MSFDKAESQGSGRQLGDEDQACSRLEAKPVIHRSQKTEAIAKDRSRFRRALSRKSKIMRGNYHVPLKYSGNIVVEGHKGVNDVEVGARPPINTRALMGY